jgi:hypothetical protein
MGKLKEKYLSNSDANQDEFLDFEYNYSTWLDGVNSSIKLKYSNKDIKSVLDEVLYNNEELKNKILEKLDIYYL